MPFKSNVFINCPFDQDYLPLLRTLLFTILSFELEPQISETKDGSTVRVENIQRLIKSSKYSIHDLSRSEAMTAGEYPRFNMPFELGLDIGCKIYGNTSHKSKHCLILANSRYQYQRVLSDIAGQDISSHENDKQKLIRVVRNWFSRILKQQLAAPATIWESYNEFTFSMYEGLTRDGFSSDDINELPFADFMRIVREWLRIERNS